MPGLATIMGVTMVFNLMQAPPEAGAALDAVPFGQVHRWNDDGTDFGVFWEDPRDIFRVEVRFADAETAPPADSFRLEYWQASWPERRIPRDAPSGAGASGWHDVGDWYKGEWRTADTEVSSREGAMEFTFRPVNAREFPELKDFDAAYRTTFKVRIVADAPLPEVASFAAYTDSTLDPLDFEIEWGGTAAEEQVWDGRLEVFNGFLQSVEAVAEDSGVTVAADQSWASRVAGRTDGIRARILRANSPAYQSFDETVVTVRNARDTFSFSASDLIERGPVFLPYYGVLVRKAGDATTYAAAAEAWRNTPERDRDIYGRVFDAPEQTLTQAWNDMPAKRRHEIPLSFEGSRQHFRLDVDGSVLCNKNWIERIPGKDSARCLWEGREIEYTFDLPDTPSGRELEHGCLPIVHTSWDLDGYRCTQTAFAVPLNGVPPRGARVWADDTQVLLLRFRLETDAPGTVPVRIAFNVRNGGISEELTLQGDAVLPIGAEEPRLRMMVLHGRTGLRAEDGRLVFGASIGGGASAELHLAIPFVTLTAPGEWDRVRALRFDAAHQDVAAHWLRRVNEGAQIRTPEPMINEFYRAHLPHLLINTEREVGVSDRYMAKVGTFHYGVFSNESCMMISDLDRRGYHERAEQALETWIHYQGTVPLPGDYSSHDGVFYGAGGYEMGGYNQHHGWVLWCMGEHYWYTRDAAWLTHAAPAIVRACDWITNERRRTIEAAETTPIRAIERGLLPPGSLEDIGDWRCWLSTNVYSWWGMDNAARALAAVNHPEAPRLVKDAQDYRNDIRAAFLAAMERSPVVRLRDGSWVPHVPSEVHRRGRSFGWITETLEGAIHLVRCGIVDPAEPLAVWILKDFEDNLYLSEQFGYDLGDEFGRYWFSRGGISMQANLLCSPMPYLFRDEPKHFLRAYFNAFAVSYFPDTRMMTEHALPDYGDWRGDHYKTSDEANSTYWLRLMVIQERGDELWLGSAVPRYWLSDGQTVSIENAATYFGPMSMKLESRVSEGAIRMTIDGPLRNPPRIICARFRHPEGKRIIRCTVDGQPYDRFDPDKEWVEIDAGTTPREITVFYP